MPRVQVNIQEVVLHPEDVIGSGDEFYVIGAVSDGTQSEGIASVPIQLDSGEAKPFGVWAGLSSTRVSHRPRAQGRLDGLRRGCSQDWAKQGEVVDQIATAVSSGLRHRI